VKYQAVVSGYEAHVKLGSVGIVDNDIGLGTSTQHGNVIDLVTISGALVSPDENDFSGPFGGASGGTYSYMAGDCSRYLPDEEEQQRNEDQFEECEYQSRHCVTLPGT
jgi:hypothetical protein